MILLLVIFNNCKFPTYSWHSSTFSLLCRHPCLKYISVNSDCTRLIPIYLEIHNQQTKLSRTFRSKLSTGTSHPLPSLPYGYSIRIQSPTRLYSKISERFTWSHTTKRLWRFLHLLYQTLTLNFLSLSNFESLLWGFIIPFLEFICVTFVENIMYLVDCNVGLTAEWCRWIWKDFIDCVKTIESSSNFSLGIIIQFQLKSVLSVQLFIT